MKRAILSCIHGNLEALEAVLRDVERQRVEAIYCLGDLVGYGPYPSEVVERVRTEGIATVKGCWDEDVVEGLDACDCSYPSLLAEARGRLAHEWTARVLSPAALEFLADLPDTMAVDTPAGRLVFVHGSPNSAHEYLLAEIDAFAALERVLAAGADLLFCGHTHIPYERSLDGGTLRAVLTERDRARETTEPSTATPRSLAVSLKRIVNAGSVGEPRHGRPHATYAIFDDETGAVLLREVAYDTAKTCAAIVEKGLPPAFAWRLAQGLEYAERAEDPGHVCAR